MKIIYKIFFFTMLLIISTITFGILSNKLFDYQHSCISNGVIYLEDSQEQGILC